MPDTGAERERISAICTKLAKTTGDARFSRAAGILAGKHIGRRAIDDGPALGMAQSLVDAGLVRSRNAACIRAARFYAPTCGVDAMRARLMKKLRTKKLNP